MKNLLLTISALSTPFALQAAIFTTVGTYDENVVVANTVDSSLTSYTVAQFTSDVSTAYAANSGGVIGFNGYSTNQLFTTIEAPFGTDSSKTLNISFGGGLTHHTALSLGSASPISGQSIPGHTGSTALGQGPNADSVDANVDIDFLFDSITGGEAFEAITKVGLTYVGRSNGGGLDNSDNVTITAFFSNATSSSVTTNANNAGGERFVGFEAPANTSITRLLIDIPADINRRVYVDDLGFVTSVVPEPSTYAAIAAGLLVLVTYIRNRRK